VATRLQRLGRGFWRAAARLMTTSTTRTLVMNMLDEIATSDSLPGDDDTPTIIAPALPVHARRVAGAGLWVWFTWTETELYVLALTDSPPTVLP
jgi:hypothetical protein